MKITDSSEEANFLLGHPVDRISTGKRHLTSML